MFSNLSGQQTRSLVIFAAYNTTCLLVACRCVHIITREKRRGPVSSPPSSTQHDDARIRRRMRMFGAAALFSILSTWYFMIRFYVHSYQDWLVRNAVLQASKQEDGSGLVILLASWLRDTKLFEQAWSAVVKTQTRLWWSQQIFGFCAGWSVFLGFQGKS